MSKKMMVLVCVLSAALLLLFGCAPSSPASQTSSYALQDIADGVLRDAGEDLSRLESKEINAENEHYYLGVEGLEYTEAVAIEPKINAIPFSFCLIRMEEGANIEEGKQRIAKNVDPWKWICVGVSDDQVVVDSAGNIIVLIMAEDAQPIAQSFLKFKNQ